LRIQLFLIVLLKPYKTSRMKKLFTLVSITFTLAVSSQTQIANGGFELWDNPTGSNAEPQQFNSNKTGSSNAQLGPQTCFREATNPHSGTYCVRLETTNFIIAVVNGNATTGVVNAPTTSKADGNVGTVNFSNATDIRKMAFTGRPDSLVGWYRYTSGGTGEQGKVRAILHTGDYWDPETPTTHHPACIANKIGAALFMAPTGNQTAWKRFSVPFSYTSTANPTHIMVNMTSSANQLTTIAGSKIWLDDIAVVYNSTKVNTLVNPETVKVYSSNKTIFVDYSEVNIQESVLTVYDITGKIISTYNIENGKVNSFEFSNLNSGLYLYQLTGADLKKSGKLILE